MALNSIYTHVPGCFVTDDPQADPNTMGALPDRFGLLDSSRGHWEKFQLKIAALNAEGASKSSTKVFFLGRHGEGYHNVGMAKYSRPEWDGYWSKLNGDGTIVWGPDPALTPLGIQQAEAAHDKWSNEILSGIPVPTVFYSSPHIRAAHTLEITWTGITLPSKTNDRPLYPSHEVIIAENCREVYGVHTCDKRHPKSWIAERYPSFAFDEGFTEEDELWTPDNQESEEHVDTRVLSTFEHIWARYPEESYISITSHTGFIRGLLRVIGRGNYGLPTGGVLAIVIKRTVS